MKALTIRQPWAHLLLREEGRKPIENRTWMTHYRGPILIHTAKTPYSAEFQEAYKTCDKADVQRPPLVSECSHGAVIGLLTIEDVLSSKEAREKHPNWHTDGHRAWVMSNPIRLSGPVQASGSTSFWYPSNDVLDRIIQKGPAHHILA